MSRRRERRVREKPRGPLFIVGILVVGLGLVGGGFAAYAMTLPSQWNVERTAVITAPPEVIHQRVGASDRWSEFTVWNPVPGLELTDSDPATGVGYAMQVDGYPTQGTIRYEGLAAGTRVIWTDKGTISNPVNRFFIGSIEVDLAGKLDEALVRLKSQVEREEGDRRTAEAQARAAEAAEKRAKLRQQNLEDSANYDGNKLDEAEKKQAEKTKLLEGLYGNRTRESQEDIEARHKRQAEEAKREAEEAKNGKGGKGAPLD